MGLFRKSIIHSSAFFSTRESATLVTLASSRDVAASAALLTFFGCMSADPALFDVIRRLVVMAAAPSEARGKQECEAWAGHTVGGDFANQLKAA